jgi:arsenate reductase (thioredoxin)
VNPRAVKAMKDTGVDMSTQTSDLIDPTILNRADYVITLCGDANDKCPVTPPRVHRIHWGLPDPAKATGTEPEIEAKCKEVRDDIRDRFQRFLSGISK